MYVLGDTIERLGFLEANQGTTCESPLLRSSKQIEPKQGLLSQMFASVFSDQPATPILTREQVRQSALNKKRMSNLVTFIVQQWDLEPIMPGSSQPTPQVFGNSQQEEDLYPVAPGVYAPETRGVQHALTKRGKEQVKKGLRKCTPDDVVSLGDIPNRIVHDREIESLVPIFVGLGRVLDQSVILIDYSIRHCSRKCRGCPKCGLDG